MNYGSGKFLSLNTSLPWSYELIRKISRQMGLGKSLLELGYSLVSELIESYRDHWVWSRLNFNSAITWTIELLERYQDKWDWSNLDGDWALPWSIELLERYQDRWDKYDWEALARTESINSSIFKDILTDQMIEEFLSKINQKTLLNS